MEAQHHQWIPHSILIFKPKSRSLQQCYWLSGGWHASSALHDIPCCWSWSHLTIYHSCCLSIQSKISILALNLPGQLYMTSTHWPALRKYCSYVLTKLIGLSHPGPIWSHLLSSKRFMWVKILFISGHIRHLLLRVPYSMYAPITYIRRYKVCCSQPSS